MGSQPRHAAKFVVLHLNLCLVTLPKPYPKYHIYVKFIYHLIHYRSINNQASGSMRSNFLVG